MEVFLLYCYQISQIETSMLLDTAINTMNFSVHSLSPTVLKMLLHCRPSEIQHETGHFYNKN